MKESLLHYVWKTKNFQFSNCKTTENEKVQIENFGIYNLNAGPDFLEGRISLEGTTWFGHIEMHVYSSDWIKHNHQIDEAYQNVILHVVWEEDEIIYLKDGTRVPCIELKNYISYHILESFNRFDSRNEKIACSQELQTEEKDLFYLQLNRIFVERLENKCYPIAMELDSNKYHWSQTLFIQISKAFGLPVNHVGMETLARKIPINLISRHLYNPFQLEALFFGQANMLSTNWKDSFPIELFKEYTFLKNKYLLNSLSGKEWKLLRMRPTSYPTLRISQLANLYSKEPDLHSKILEITDIETLYKLFECTASAYWNDHYLFDKQSHFRVKKLGRDSITKVIVNAIVPFLFAYGQFTSEDKYIERSLHFMEQIKAESNKIISEWKSYTVKVRNALESQALIQLKKNYCDKKRCLECAFGNKVLKNISSKVQEEAFIEFLI